MAATTTRAGPIAKLQGPTIVSTVCGGRALFNLSLLSKDTFNLSLLSKDTREGASAIGLPSGFWQLLGPGRANTECRPALTANKAPCCCIACGNGAQPCSMQPTASSAQRAARAVRSAQLRIQLHRQRDARIKRQKELLSLFLICFKKRHYVQQINCNRSNQLQQIGCKTDQSETGGAHRHSGRTASAMPANLIEMPVGSVLVSDSRVIGCWVGCP